MPRSRKGKKRDVHVAVSDQIGSPLVGSGAPASSPHDSDYSNSPSVASLGGGAALLTGSPALSAVSDAAASEFRTITLGEPALNPNVDTPSLHPVTAEQANVITSEFQEGKPCCCPPDLNNCTPACTVATITSAISACGYSFVLINQVADLLSIRRSMAINFALSGFLTACIAVVDYQGMVTVIRKGCANLWPKQWANRLGAFAAVIAGAVEAIMTYEATIELFSKYKIAPLAITLAAIGLIQFMALEIGNLMKYFSSPLRALGQMVHDFKIVNNKYVCRDIGLIVLSQIFALTGIVGWGFLAFGEVNTLVEGILKKAKDKHQLDETEFIAGALTLVYVIVDWCLFSPEIDKTVLSGLLNQEQNDQLVILQHIRDALTNKLSLLDQDIRTIVFKVEADRKENLSNELLDILRIIKNVAHVEELVRRAELTQQLEALLTQFAAYDAKLVLNAQEKPQITQEIAEKLLRLNFPAAEHSAEKRGEHKWKIRVAYFLGAAFALVVGVASYQGVVDLLGSKHMAWWKHMLFGFIGLTTGVEIGLLVKIRWLNCMEPEAEPAANVNFGYAPTHFFQDFCLLLLVTAAKIIPEWHVNPAESNVEVAWSYLPGAAVALLGYGIKAYVKCLADRETSFIWHKELLKIGALFALTWGLGAGVQWGLLAILHRHDSHSHEAIQSGAELAGALMAGLIASVSLRNWLKPVPKAQQSALLANNNARFMSNERSKLVADSNSSSSAVSSYGALQPGSVFQ